MDNREEKKDRGHRIKSAQLKWRSINKATKEKNSNSINGDGLQLKMETNNEQLEIIGDGCRLTIVNNYGDIKMIGDGGRLEIIERNSGVIQYQGDGGRIILPDTVNSSSNLVHYIGDGGKIGNKKTQNQRVMSQKRPCDTTGTNCGTGNRRTTKLIISRGVKQEIYSPQ